MKAFIDRAGNIKYLNCEHLIFCQQVLKVSFTEYLMHNVRIQTCHDVMGAEISSPHMTASQYRATRKLYREYRCLVFVGRINKKIIDDIKLLRSFVK